MDRELAEVGRTRDGRGRGGALLVSSSLGGRSDETEGGAHDDGSFCDGDDV